MLLCALLAVPLPAFAAEMLSIHQDKSGETIIFAPGNVSPNKVFTLDNPDRLVVDVPPFASAGLRLPSDYKNGIISHLRTGRFNANTSRLVFELSEKTNVASKNVKNGKLIIQLAPASGEAAAKEEKEGDSGPSLAFLFGRKVEKPTVEAPKPGKDEIGDTRPEPVKTENPFRKASDKNRQPKPVREIEEKSPPPDETRAPVEKKKSSREKKSASYAPVKKDKLTVVIDAGHGGIDPGTSGSEGTVEKMITLEYAQALRNRLQKSGHYQVVLTRDNDQFIMLRKRVDIARKAHGDIFVSLHADSAPGEARGLSIYTVSEKASDEEAEKLAARENKADVLAGINLEGEREDVAGILISLAERETKNRSAMLADILVTSLDDKVHLLPDSHRFAGFAVLKAPDIPSVLVEIGFLSNPQEEKMIKSKAYRDKVVAGIAAGIDGYFKKERQLEE